jgi:UDP-N-acetylmuramoylalanine-D-glutamate ligase
VAGNISPAALDVLREVLDTDELPQAWVLELSSFQLHTTFSLNPDAATVLNVTQDHLDWHGSMTAYAFDKARIFGKDTVRVLNRDDATVMRMSSPDARDDLRHRRTGRPGQLRPGERARRAVAGQRESGGRAGKETPPSRK